MTLDNPMWHALRGPNRAVALTYGVAARYDPEVATFAGLPDEPDPGAWADLTAMYRPGERAVLAGKVVTPPEPWEIVGRIEAVQMVGPTRVHRHDAGPGTSGTPLGAPLGPGDVADMLDLVARTRPGPFFPRTVELGGYVGIRREGRLVAMAGHRMHLPGFTEISAVCTDPEIRGRGIAGTLVAQVVDGIATGGEQPFLHVSVTNRAAISLYEGLGFRERTRLAFFFLQIPPPDQPGPAGTRVHSTGNAASTGGHGMGHGPRRSTRRILLGGLAAITVAAGTALPASAAFAADDYPVPPSPTVSPNNETRNPTSTGGSTSNRGTSNSGLSNGSPSNGGTEVLGRQVTRGSLPFTGGDIAGIAAIGAGAVAVGAVMVRRSRRAGATA